MGSLQWLFAPKKLKKIFQYLPCRVRRKKEMEKAKILNELEMRGSFFSPKCSQVILNL